jgi:hypothetical protein
MGSEIGQKEDVGKIPTYNPKSLAGVQKKSNCRVAPHGNLNTTLIS